MLRSYYNTRQYAFPATPVVSKRLNEKVFSQLYTTHVSRIYRYVQNKVGSCHVAEDLTAQVFMKAWQARRRYQWTQYPFSAWLFRIAHNLVVDYYRMHHETVLVDDFPLYESADNVEELAEKHFDSESLRCALNQLTGDQHQVILLKFLEGYSTSEIATMMHRDSTAIRALQHRALIALHRILQNDLERPTRGTSPRPNGRNIISKNLPITV